MKGTKRLTAIVKPTHECNLACRYCYVEESAENGRMNSKTLQNMTRQLSNFSVEGVNIIWHGGEPLLMGLDFYREAIDIQRNFKEVNFKNSIQSNATLITNETLDFCEDNRISIGTSIDGPEEIHNLIRIYPNGEGSFKEAWKGLRMIEQRKGKSRGGNKRRIGGGAITILTKMNLDKILEVYNFFKSQGIHIKINPLIKSGRGAENHSDLGISPIEYGKALTKLFDQWFYEKEKGIDVDPLSAILGNQITENPTTCNFGKSCREEFISVGPQGDVYPCGRFDGIKEYWLGNINQNKDLVEILAESKTNKLLLERSSETVKGCSDCDYSRICNAGCMHNAYMQRGNILDKDFYCASYQILFKHLEKALNVELNKALVEVG